MPIVKYNAVVDDDATRTWDVLKAFGEISKWHPAISDSYIEDGKADGLVGCVRRLTLVGGAVLRERLLMVDEREMAFSYCFEEVPLPLDHYVAKVEVIPVTDQKKVIIRWTASFDVRDLAQQVEQTEGVRKLVVDGHESLQEYLKQNPAK
ncbi:Polyketide cyclase / dehydrase and lipid transport [compost metagenome]